MLGNSTPNGRPANPDPQPRRYPSGSCVVSCTRLSPRRVTLGPWDTKHDRPSDLAELTWAKVKARWIAGGREPLDADTIEQVKADAREAIGTRDLRHAAGRVGRNYRDARDVVRRFTDRPAAPVHTVNDVLDAYIRDKRTGTKRVTPARLKDYESHFAWFRKRYGAVPANSCTVQTLVEVQRLLIDEQKLNWRTINQRITYFVQAFRHGRVAGLVDRVVVADLDDGVKVIGLTEHSEGVKARRIDERESRGVAQPVFDRTLHHVPPVVRDMLRLLLLTGMRPKELCDMRTCDVNTRGGVWHYTPRTHKTAHRGKARTISIGPKAQPILRAYLRRETTEPVFTFDASGLRTRADARRDPNGPLRTPDLTKAVVLACKRAKLSDAKRWTPYDLRHEFANRAAREAAVAFAKREAAKLAASQGLGHANTRTGELYGDGVADRMLADEVAIAIG